MCEQYNDRNYKQFFNKQCEVCTMTWEHEIDNEAKLDWWIVDGKFYCPDHVPKENSNVSR